MNSFPGALALGLGAGWCALHLLVYFAWLRVTPAFYGEGRIFRYHLISATGYSALVILLFAVAPSWHAFTCSTGLIALHGLYSLSFLELWSLAQGSYSLSILAGVDGEDGTGSQELTQRFSELGNAKKAARIDGLFRLGLVGEMGDRIELTRRGRLASAGCAMLRWLPNLRETG